MTRRQNTSTLVCFVIAAIMLSPACSDEDGGSGAGDLVCTEEFVSYVVTVLDTNDRPVDSLDISIDVIDHQEFFEFAPLLNKRVGPGRYLLLDDSVRELLEFRLTNIEFRAFSPRISFWRRYTFIADECHISKLAGPDTIRIEF